MTVCIFSTANQIEAGLVKSALDEAKIDNYLQNYTTQSLGGMWSPFAGTNLAIGDIKVMIKEEDVEEALEIIKIILGDDEQTTTDNEDNSAEPNDEPDYLSLEKKQDISEDTEKPVEDDQSGNENTDTITQTSSKNKKPTAFWKFFLIVIFVTILVSILFVIGPPRKKTLNNPLPSNNFNNVEALSKTPNNVTAYYKRGNEYASIGNYDLAIADFTQAIQLDSKFAIGYFCRGFAYLQINDYTQAINDFTQAIELDPNLVDSYGFRGEANHKIGEYDQAITDYTKFLKINPNSAPAYSGLGMAYLYKGDFNKAIANITFAIRLEPDYAIAYNNRGLVYQNMNDYDQAIKDYTQALRLNPNDAIIHYNRGDAYFLKSDFDEAIEDFNQVIKLNPNYTMAYYSRGLAFYHKGNIDQAIADWETTLRINPNDVNAKQNLEFVREQYKR